MGSKRRWEFGLISGGNIQNTYTTRSQFISIVTFAIKTKNIK